MAVRHAASETRDLAQATSSASRATPQVAPTSATAPVHRNAATGLAPVPGPADSHATPAPPAA